MSRMSFSQSGQSANRPKYKAAFQDADKDGSGSINKEEFKEVLEDLGKRAGQKEVDRMFARFDEDGSGSINLNEFLLFLDDIDHAWIRIQTKTFTRWANTVLSNRMEKIDDLCGGIKDGLKLAILIEILAKKSVGKVNKKARMKLQRAENINKCLTFLKRDGIRLVNVGADDIEEGNLKIVLGLIWMLILKYQIGDSVEEGSPKWELLEWVKKQIAPYNTGVTLKNFKTGWSDGKVLSALTDSLGDVMNETVDTTALSDDPYEATEKACNTAESEFDIPVIMDAHDLVENPEEHSIMTYVSYFRDYANNMKSKPCPANCTATGPGVEGGDVRAGTAPFTITAKNKQGKTATKGGSYFAIAVEDPTGNKFLVEDIKDNGNGTYDGAYDTKVPGDYKVSIMLNNQHIKDSEFTVRMEAGCAANSYAEGEGLSTGKTGAPCQFTIFSVASDGAKVECGGDPFLVTITGPNGNAFEAVVTDGGDGTYPVEYTVTDAGDHTIAVTLHGDAIKDAPFTASIKRATNAGLSWAEGPGLKKAFQDRDNTFTVHAVGDDGEPVCDGGDDAIAVTMSPADGGGDVPVQVTDNKDGTYSCAYAPTVLGDYVISVKLDDDDVKDTPVNITVKRAPNAGLSYAEGPGIEKAFQDRPNVFTVHAKGDDGEPVSGDDCKVTMKPTDEDSGLPEVEVGVVDNGDGTYTCEYQPTELGDYTIGVQLEGEDVKDTPVQITVKRAVNAGNSWADGPGLKKAFDNKPAKFTVHARGDDNEPVWGVDCTVTMKPEDASSDLKEVEVAVLDNEDGTYSCAYSPTEKGQFVVSVQLEGDDVKDTPVSVQVREGACVEKMGKCTFKATIVTRNKEGELKTEGGDDWEVSIQGPEESEIPVKTTDNGDGSYSAEYKLENDKDAEGPQEYVITMTLNEDNIPGSPYRQFM